jgi:hypothetical protein
LVQGQQGKERIMDTKVGRKKAKKTNGKKGCKNQGMVLPVIIPLFPFGVFPLPLFIPCPPATGPNDNK